MVALAKRYGWSNDWFFDGRKALFAPSLSFCAQTEDLQASSVMHCAEFSFGVTPAC